MTPRARASPSPGVSADPDTTERLRDVLVRGLHTEPASVETDLIDSGLLDSLALVELLFAIEQEFGVTLDLAEFDIDNFRTIRRIGETIESLLIPD